MQRMTLSTSSIAEIMMTGMCRRCGSAFNRSSTSYPFMSGIMISSKTRSMGFACSTSKASRPLVAVATLVYPRRLSRRVSVYRLSSLSSTTRSAASGTVTARPSWPMPGSCRAVEAFRPAWYRSHRSPRQSPSRDRQPHGVRRQRDHRDVPRFGRGFDPMRRLPTVEHRQTQVHQNHVGLLGGRHGYGLCAIGGDEHRVPCSRQPALQHVDIVLIVLDVQDFHSLPPSSRSAPARVVWSRPRKPHAASHPVRDYARHSPAACTAPHIVSHFDLRPMQTRARVGDVCVRRGISSIGSSILVTPSGDKRTIPPFGGG